MRYVLGLNWNKTKWLVREDDRYTYPHGGSVVFESKNFYAALRKRNELNGRGAG